VARPAPHVPPQVRDASLNLSCPAVQQARLPFLTTRSHCAPTTAKGILLRSADFQRCLVLFHYTRKFLLGAYVLPDST
jgi:hypothetical protein